MKMKLLVLTIFTLLSLNIFAQNSESFEGIFPPAGWTFSGWEKTDVEAHSGSYSARSNGNSGSFLKTGLLQDVKSLSFWYKATDINSILKYTISGLIMSVNPPDVNWHKISVDFVDSMITYLKFEAICSGELSYVYVDDIEANVPLPVGLEYFNLTNKAHTVFLSWRTAYEINNDRFEIYRNDVFVGSIKGSGTINSPINWTFPDKNLNIGHYQYCLKQIDYNGNSTSYFQEIDIIRPNTLKGWIDGKIFHLENDSFCSYIIYDILGRQIQSEKRNPGYYQIPLNLVTGIYFVRLFNDYDTIVIKFVFK
jgi:hypothetical protein